MERIPARSRAWQYTEPDVHRWRRGRHGDVGVTDQTARSHEMMPKLVAKLDALAGDMRRASDGGRPAPNGSMKYKKICEGLAFSAARARWSSVSPGSRRFERPRGEVVRCV
jgi:hypothetical protein